MDVNGNENDNVLESLSKGNSGDEFANPDVNPNCNLIVNYLPHDIDDAALRELFEQFGEIVMTKVVRDKNTKKSLGYGFVKFANEINSLAALEKMNGFTVAHKTLKVSVARPPSLEIRNCKLYVTNLPKEYNEGEVVGLFKEFGDIIECRVLKDPQTKQSKGVAFVQFNVKAQANDALSLNGCQLEGSSRPLVVKYAEDQHKKKELTRLHNLTLNTAFRGGQPQQQQQQQQQQGQMQNQNKQFRGPGDNRHQMEQPRQSEVMNHPFYYQSQNMANMYNNPQPPSPMQMVHSPMNSNQMYLPPNAATSPVHDFNKRGNKPRKGFGYESPTMASAPAPVGNWGFPQQLPYIPSTLPPPPALHPNQSVDMNNFPPSPHLHGVPMNVLPSPQNQQFAARNNRNAGFPGASPLNTIPYNTNPGAPVAAPANFNSPNNITISVSNLPPNADVNLLHEIFSNYGKITSAQIDDSPVSRVSNGAPRQSRGRLQMANISQAESAVQALNGAVVFEGGLPLQVQFV